METFKKISHNITYEVSNYGNIRNSITGKLLKPTIHIRKGRNNPTKYLRIELKKPRKKHLVHRLVAEAFLENAENLISINHKDENGLNNHIDNLEWCTNRYNCIYSQGRKVRQLNLNGVFIDAYDSLTIAAEKTGSQFKLISLVCLGKRKSHNNYKWEYE